MNHCRNRYEFSPGRLRSPWRSSRREPALTRIRKTIRGTPFVLGLHLDPGAGKKLERTNVRCHANFPAQIILQNHDKRGHAIWHPDIMKSKLRLWVFLLFLLAVRSAPAQTNLTDLLQQGMFEEEANHNLPAAISNYQALAARFDQDRQLAATAIFRLGECYREAGNTNEAAAEYHRVIREFPDQKTLVTLSRQDLAGMGFSQPSAPVNPAAAGNSSTDANLLAKQIAGIESLKSPEEEARALLAIFPSDCGPLDKMLLQLPKLQKQDARLEAEPQSILGDYFTAVGPGGVPEMVQGHNSNLDGARRELHKQLSWIQARVNFVLDLQKARLKVLQAAAPSTQETAQTTAPSDDEDQEIARIQSMLQNSPDLINAPETGGMTPLENAAAKGQLKVAAYLLEHGADINLEADGETPLIAAANAAQMTMVKLLLDHGADINAKGSQGDTALHDAVSASFEAVVQTLLGHRADVNVTNDAGETPLILAAQNGKAKIVQMLLSAGADPDIRAANGDTALSRAASVSSEIVKFLLASGANPNIANEQGRTPLSYATQFGSFETVKSLLAAKAGPNGGTLDLPLFCSIHDHNLNAAKSLLDAGADPNLKCKVDTDFPKDSNNHATPLWSAIQMKELTMVQLLLKYKANPNDSQIENRPVIFWALSDTNILEALLNAGANPNVCMGNDSILTKAIDENDAAAVEILLNHNANPNLRTSNGETPALPIAIFNLNEKIVRLLLNHAADPNVKTAGYDTPLKFLEKIASGNISVGNRVSPEQQKKLAASIAALLRRHGALEVLPDWNHITVSRPAIQFSHEIFSKGTNDWNQFTLFDLLGVQYELLDAKASGNDVLRYNDYGGYPLKNSLPFPDFSRIVIHRPPVRGSHWANLKIDLSHAFDTGDCAADVPLKFGDVVEIPESDHLLNEQWDGLSTNELFTLAHCLTRHLQITVAGLTTNLTVGPKVESAQSGLSPEDRVLIAAQHVQIANPYVINTTFGRRPEVGPNVFAYQPLMLWPVLKNSQLLLSSSDLSHITVKRRDPETGKIRQWTVDCSNPKSPPNFWLRDGDIITVPEN